MKDRTRKIGLLLAWGLGLWLFFGFIGPFLIEHIPDWKRYAEIQEKQGLDSGALYYTNVPQTQAAEEAMRRAVKDGMDMRRQIRLKEQNGGK